MSLGASLHQLDMFGDRVCGNTNAVRQYDDVLTVDVNQKGVLDVDVVKGCTAGIAAHGGKGCYQACYASTIARFRGIDFSRAVVRKVKSYSQARMIERAVKASPSGFFRIGTMGDPCHAWEETVGTVEWLAPHAIPIIITKHWRIASDAQLNRLVICGAIVNTSVSALDTAAQLTHRLAQIQRYAGLGGTSVARVVSCDFNTDDAVGATMDRTQLRLFALRPMIDNPLRANSTHPLVEAGVIKLRKVKDLTSERSVSIAEDSQTYLGHCSSCTDLCGAGLLAQPDTRTVASQGELL